MVRRQKSEPLAESAQLTAGFEQSCDAVGILT